MVLEKSAGHKRIEWLDIIKGYCMLFVMPHHLPFVPMIYKSIYAPFFLTAFWISGGYTFNSEMQWNRFLIKKVQTLLVPTMVLGLICIVSSQILSFNEISNMGEQLRDLLLQDGTDGHRLWFVAAMFVACCIFYPISKIKDTKVYFLVLFLLGVGNIVFCEYVYGGYLPWHLSVMGVICVWMGIGYYIRKSIPIDRLEKILCSKYFLGGVVLVYSILEFIAIKFLGVQYIGFSDWQEGVLLYFIINIIGVSVIAGIANLIIPRWISNIIIFIGQNTLFYFAFHGKIESLLIAVIHKIGIGNLVWDYSYISSVLLTLLTAVVLIIPCMIFRKLLPFAVGKTYRRVNKRVV